MKRDFIFLLSVMLVLVFSNSLWAQCPEAANDLGSCDTLHIIPYPQTDTCFISCFQGICDTMCINNPGQNFPCFLYVNLFIEHDSNTFWWSGGNKWTQDSLAAFIVPLTWTRTNPADYCSLSDYWNQNVLGWWFPDYPRSIWRYFPKLDADSVNRYEWLTEQGKAWGSQFLSVCTDSCLEQGVLVPPHAFINATLVSASAQRWWEGKPLFATLTFRLQDSMTICMDSTFWPPASFVSFTRYDTPLYVPRDNMPYGIKVKSDGSVDTCTCSLTDVRWIEDFPEEEESSPSSFFISQNYPNPFNPATEFKVALPTASHVKIEIFNILGQKVKTLVDKDMRAGVFLVDWDAKDERGVEASSGIYFYRIVAGDFYDIKKMVLLR